MAIITGANLVVVKFTRLRDGAFSGVRGHNRNKTLAALVETRVAALSFRRLTIN
jgi:hypothetical protein